MTYFETRFMEEANEFIAGLDQKLQKKSFTISILHNKRMTQNCLKNYKMIFGNLGRSLEDFKSVCWHFGISQITKIHW